MPWKFEARLRFPLINVGTSWRSTLPWILVQVGTWKNWRVLELGLCLLSWLGKVPCFSLLILFKLMLFAASILYSTILTSGVVFVSWRAFLCIRMNFYGIWIFVPDKVIPLDRILSEFVPLSRVLLCIEARTPRSRLIKDLCMHIRLESCVRIFGNTITGSSFLDMSTAFWEIHLYIKNNPLRWQASVANLLMIRSWVM